MKHRARRSKGVGAEGAFQAINITPFTDVLLVLLIIFLIAGSSLAPSGVGVDKLSARSSQSTGGQTQTEVTTLYVQDGRLLRLTGDPLSPEELEKLERNKPIDLTASEDCPVKDFVTEYDRLLKMGFRDVRLAQPSTLEL